jgi:hypothetical protein
MKGMYKKGGKDLKSKVMKEAKREKESFMEESKELSFGRVKKETGGPGDEMSRGEARLTNRINRNKLKLEQAQKEYNQSPDDPKDLYRSTPGGTEMLEKYIEQKTNKVKKLEDRKNRKYPTKTYVAKTGGAKSMEPGGGGRFAKMVKGLKKSGKSEESAEAIAASIGRKKYGKSKFQAMANAGKKKMGGANC